MSKSCHIHEVRSGGEVYYHTLISGRHRYLTKICGQIFALVSDEDASKIIWRSEEEEQQNVVEKSPALQGNIEGIHRFISFEVVKTKEQEENVITRPGFTVSFIIHLLCYGNDGYRFAI